MQSADEYYLGPFPKQVTQQLASCIKNHLGDLKDQNARTVVEGHLDQGTWRTRDQIIGTGGQGANANVGTQQGGRDQVESRR
jgi:hypothetical protein